MFPRHRSHSIWWLSLVAIGVAALLVLQGVGSGPAGYVGAQEGTEVPTEESAGEHEEGEEAHPEGEEELSEQEREAIEEGRQVFLDNACFACHGQDAEGSEIAPALAGHSEAAVRRQVRAPTGIMPVFPPDKISSSELDALVAYITSLSGEHHHEQVNAVGPMLAQHHWMALYALEGGNVEEALHHVGHIIELLEEGPHLGVMQEVEQQLREGEVHEAEHTLQEMLTDVAEPTLSPEQIHLQMALAAIRVEEPQDATHHLEHFLEVTSGEMHEQAQTVLDLIESDELHDAEHMLEEMLGTLQDEGAQAEHAHEEDEHMEEMDEHMDGGHESGAEHED